MRSFRYRQHVVIATVAAAATGLLLGCQQLITPMAHAPVEDKSLSFRALETQKATFQNAAFQSAAFMPAAVVSGDFEESFQPVAATVIAPAPAPEPAPEVKSEAATHDAEMQIASVEKAKALEVYESGIASTYGQGDGFEGLRTGCGQIFRTHVVQVAHKTLPCGTVIRIEDRDTGKSVDAEVTDRGPYVAGRIVDLSYAAFTKLDASGTGLLRVNVYILDTSNQYLYKLR